jgi:hypothetical protein
MMCSHSATWLSVISPCCGLYTSVTVGSLFGLISWRKGILLWSVRHLNVCAWYPVAGFHAAHSFLCVRSSSILNIWSEKLHFYWFVDVHNLLENNMASVVNF